MYGSLFLSLAVIDRGPLSADPAQRPKYRDSLSAAQHEAEEITIGRFSVLSVAGCGETEAAVDGFEYPSGIGPPPELWVRVIECIRQMRRQLMA